jgi:hypothetical protein
MTQWSNEPSFTIRYCVKMANAPPFETRTNRTFNDKRFPFAQFVDWPDHGVPETPDAILKLRAAVEKVNDYQATAIPPTISAAVSTTGHLLISNFRVSLLRQMPSTPTDPS